MIGVVIRTALAQGNRGRQVWSMPAGLAVRGGRPDNGAMQDEKMQLSLSVNGERMAQPGGATVAMLIAELALDIRKVAVERNREIVPRSSFGSVKLEQDDQIEIVHFIGGG